MATFNVIGFIDNIKYLPDSVLLFLSEYKKGYRKQNGEIVDDKYITWKIIFKPYFKKYINVHFNTGMLVQVLGEILPYAIEHEKMIDGYSVLGKTIDLFSYPRSSVKQEQRMIKESQLHSSGIPDLEGYNEPDF